MIYKLVPSEAVEPTEEAFKGMPCSWVSVEKLEDVIFIKVPLDLTMEEIQELDKTFMRAFGSKKYIVLSDTVNFVKLEEVK